MKNQETWVWPCSATSCDAAFAIPLPLWACLSGSVLGNQVASAGSYLPEPLFFF